MTTPSCTLRVTTVRPCSNAVAEIIGSALSLPRAALGPTSGYLQIKGRNPFAVESQHRSPNYRGFCKLFTSVQYTGAHRGYRNG